MTDVKFLQSHALFGGILEEELWRIHSMLVDEHFAKGETIVREGELGDRLYFLCSGRVEIIKEGSRSTGGVPVTLAVLGEGDTFGEMELIDIQPRSATVMALDDASVLTLSNRALHQISKDNAETFAMIILNLAREISRRLRRMDALVASSLFSSTGGAETAASPAGKTAT